MKRKGSVMDFVEEREKHLLRCYRRAVKDCRHVDIKEVSAKIVEMESPRFWVSPSRAWEVVLALDRGEAVLDTMLPQKRAMYEEIYRRVKETRERKPWKKGYDCVEEVVNSPAPRCYCSPRYAMEIIYKMWRRQSIPT